MAVDLLPYEPRAFQEEAVALVARTGLAGGHLVLEAPTGTGKTVVLLAGALAAAFEGTKRVLYVTRTNSQQEQALRELAAIRAKAPRPFRAYALQGRHRLCLRLEDAAEPEWDEASPEELSHFCAYAKKLAESDPGSSKACRHFEGLLRMDAAELLSAYGDTPITAEAAKTIARARGFCSYEAAKRLLPDAEVLVAPYVFAFDAGLRARLFQWWNTSAEDVILVVDEAHNLPGYLRELFSPRLGKETLRRALGESETLEDPLVARGVSSRLLLEALADALDGIVVEYAQEDDGFVPPFELESDLLHRFRLTTVTLLQAAEGLVQLGEVVKDRRRLAGKVPKSALGNVGRFLRRWIESDEAGHVKLAVREPRPYLEAFCVDAAEAAQGLHEFHATIHASGTLAPLAEHRDTLGLGEEARLERFPSPFPPERLSIVVARGLTTKHRDLHDDPALVDRLQEATKRFLEACDVSAAVFFPSHRLLKEFVEVGVLDAHRGQVLVEDRALSQDRLMALVRSHREAPGRSLIAGVLGGRLSEGIDFPGRQLEAVVVVGAPYPKPTARQRALFHHHEVRHGRGWDYAVHAPTVRRLRQAIGRLIRSPDDRGFAAILDERAAGLLASAGIAAPLVDPEQVVPAFRAWRDAGPRQG